MDKLIAALGPAFAAGFAVQQLLELIDPLIAQFVKDNPNRKKLILGLISLVIGILIAILPWMRILVHLAQLSDASIKSFETGGNIADIFVTGLVISAGTEGFNSILKFLGYKKEEKKAQAAKEKSTASDTDLKLLNRQ
jgi:hypothetical protein